MIQAVSYTLEPLHAGSLSSRRPEPERNPAFATALTRAMQALETPSRSGPTLQEAARQMETQLATFMLKTMDQSSTGGLLGKASEGMGYFKDMFFQKMAESIVDQGGLGFEEALANAYET